MVEMVLDDGQYYCVSLCEEKCSILVSFILLPGGNHSAKHRIDLLQYFESKLDAVMEDFMNASSKAITYIPCCYCSNFHFKFKLLLEKRRQYCPKIKRPIPKEYYSDLITDQGLYYYNNLINFVIGLLFLVVSVDQPLPTTGNHVYNSVYIVCIIKQLFSYIKTSQLPLLIL